MSTSKWPISNTATLISQPSQCPLIKLSSRWHKKANTHQFTSIPYRKYYQQIDPPNNNPHPSSFLKAINKVSIWSNSHPIQNTSYRFVTVMVVCLYGRMVSLLRRINYQNMWMLYYLIGIMIYWLLEMDMLKCGNLIMEKYWGKNKVIIGWFKGNLCR